MLKKLFESNKMLPIGLDIIRILSGGIMVSYGTEITDPEQIAGYTEWLTDVGMPFPMVMAYVGKISELIGGFCLAIGLCTRLSSLPLMITMCVINFIMLDGNIRTDAFYLLLIFSCFFFVGSGKISVDFLVQNRKLVHTQKSPVNLN